MNAKTSQNPNADRLEGLDALAVVEMLDARFDDNGGPDGSAYRQLYRATKAALLAQSGAEAVHFDALLQAVDASTDVEEAIRRAGFVVGFECCRRLLLGDPDLDLLKGGAH